MPGYYETYLHGLGQLLPMARLQETERKNDFQQQMAVKALEQKYENQRRLDESLNETKRSHGERENLALKGMMLRLQQQINPPAKLVETTGGPSWVQPPSRVPGTVAPGTVASSDNPEEAAPTALMANTANQLRDERAKNIQPLDEMQQQISKLKNVIATSTPASDKQAQELLTNVFDKTRATNLLLQNNQNFGSLAGRASGMIGRFFTGQYTDEQRAQIRNMLDEMEAGVIHPSRGRIAEHYSKLAKRYKLPPELMGDTPDFYSSSSGNHQAEADAFLRKRSGQPR